MFTLHEFEDLIDQQILHNGKKSLFYEMANGQLILNLSNRTTEFFTKNSYEIITFIEKTKKVGTFKVLLEYLTNKTIKLFTEVNQYLDFSYEDISVLKNLYSDLISKLCNLDVRKYNLVEQQQSDLFSTHYKNLQTFLLETNGSDIFKKYRESPSLLPIKCAVYSPEFQIELLNININNLKQPVLDLGCGSGALVEYLRKNGIEAFGADRNIDPNDYLFKMNWFEFPFTPNTWGTVISHMAFSNHFIHHHLKGDGHFEKYIRKYMEILNSLKLGGSFIYSPSLSFIEELLIENKSYLVESKEYSTRIFRK
jgi:hypothetical protein